MSVPKLTWGVIIVTRNKMLLLALAILLCSCVPTPTPEPTCNPEPVFWPTEVIVPPEWGTPCESAWIELPTVMSMSLQSCPAYRVWGRVTVYETQPLAGAEIHVNRMVDGVQYGAGMAISDDTGEWSIDVDGYADGLRVYIIYPPGHEAWGVTSGGIPRALDVVHWDNPPQSCGPIWWKAIPRWTPTPTLTATPSRTPTRTLIPTRTATASITPTATQTRTPTVTPTATRYTVYLPAPLRMTVSPDPNERDMQKTEAFIVLVNLVRALVIGLLLSMGVLAGGSAVVKLKK